MQRELHVEIVYLLKKKNIENIPFISFQLTKSAAQTHLG